MPSLWSASARTITFNYRSDRSMRNRTILRETLCFVFQPFTGCFVRRSTHLVNFLPTQRDATPSSFARLSLRDSSVAADFFSSSAEAHRILLNKLPTGPSL